DELETALDQILAQGIGLQRARGSVLDRPPGILLRFAAAEPPKVSVEAAKFLLHSEQSRCVLNCGGDFQPVANDARIDEELFHFAVVVLRHSFRVEVVKDFAVMLALLEDGVPAQAGLRAIKNQKLEQCAVVMNRHAPFPVMVTNR